MRWLMVSLGTIAAFIVTRNWAEMVRRKAVQQVDEEASLEKIRFLQRLDHELKNPLTAMQIALANLEDTSNQDRHEEIRASMRGQILRMSHLVGDLRKLVSIENGVIEQVPVDISNLLSEVVMITQDNELSKERQFKVDFDVTNLPSILGDRDLLQLAIYNLLDNAFKFTSVNDSIILQAYMQDNELLIRVEDTGRGIPPADIPHIWKDLYQSPDVRGIAGSGIGLAMVKGIVEKHDGRVGVESIFGKGTIITIFLPYL